MKYILKSTHIPTAATGDAVVERFQPDSLGTYSCPKFPLLFFNFRDVLCFCGITVEQIQVLYVLHAVVNAITPRTLSC